MTALADDLPPHIGRYLVLKRLGEGATSDVFLARDPFQGQEVAIKRMRAWAPPADAPGSDFSSRFFSAEAALAGRLHHPNVVAILDAVSEDAAPYLVMEYVPGVTLKHFCRSDRLLALDQIVELGFKCAMALGYVFRQGVIHRDVKPANLLAVLDNGQVVDVKVSDFGSALNLHADSTQIHRVGSLAYMPPEQIEGGDVDCRADIYALGAVLYHLISGRAPFDASHQMALMHQIYHQPPLPLVGQREGVSEALDAVVLRALAKAPHDRFADWESFAQALSSLVAGQQVPLNRLGEVRDSER
ncbi:MAG: serine/threonine-protein kinase, partial [Roseateles sp.]